LGLTPTTSTTVMTVIGDALVVLMMEKIGFNAEGYAKRHHGAIWDKSRERNRDLMQSKKLNTIASPPVGDRNDSERNKRRN